MTGILVTILRMSLYGALVGLAALAVSRALNHLRAPKGVALMLWAIAALRLLCPAFLLALKIEKGNLALFTRFNLSLFYYIVWPYFAKKKWRIRIVLMRILINCFQTIISIAI